MKRDLEIITFKVQNTSTKLRKRTYHLWEQFVSNFNIKIFVKEYKIFNLMADILQKYPLTD